MSEDRFVKLKELITIVGLSRSTIYALMAKDKFPKPIHLSARTSVWRVSTIMNWANEREANKY